MKTIEIKEQLINEIIHALNNPQSLAGEWLAVEKAISIALKKHAIEFADYTWTPLGGLNEATKVYTEWITPK